MNNETGPINEQPVEKNRLEMLKDVIATSPQSIEDEFGRTANDWLSCYGSRLFAIETRLGSPKLQKLVSPETYQNALNRLEELKERLSELKRQYPEKEAIPPDEIKQELLEKLNYILE